jgi:hypothetical protein
VFLARALCRYLGSRSNQKRPRHDQCCDAPMRGDQEIKPMEALIFILGLFIGALLRSVFPVGRPVQPKTAKSGISSSR